MRAAILDGKKLAAEIRARITEEVTGLRAEFGLVPGLAVILAGDDPPSHSYVRSKEKACLQTGFHSEVYRRPESVTQGELLDLVARLNGDPQIHGILVQLPLPRRIEPQAILEAIRPDKDVDGFHPVNVGRLIAGAPAFVPCTPRGVMVLLEQAGIDPSGRRAVVLGRSNIVGKPMAALLLAANATVTVGHSRTAELAAVTREADILVVAIGKARFVTAEMVKPGAVVIDVGMNRVGDRLVGDVDFEAVGEVASHLTPVPGGVGPMTIAMLLQNTLEAARRT